MWPSCPAWLRWYKKPSYTDIKEYTLALNHERRSFSSLPYGTDMSEKEDKDIPMRLSLKRILNNQTCSPMSLYDFYMYLKHIEFSPENLEFYVWFKHYESAYAAAVKGSPYAHDASQGSPALDDFVSSNTSLDHDELQLAEKGGSQSIDLEQSNETFQSIVSLISMSAACTYSPPKGNQPVADRIKAFANTCGLTTTPKGPPTSLTTSLASESARRAELANIAALFLKPGGPKELNIPARMRQEALAGIEVSTSPESLKAVAAHCYSLVRNCSHRNFIRLGVSNGTFETVCVATTLGIVLTFAGFLTMFLLAFGPGGPRTRWYGFAPWPMWWVGVGLVLSGLRGSCFFLLLFSRRQPLPWERIEDDTSSRSARSGLLARVSRLMIFDRKLRVKDVSLRDLQRRIVMQSLLGGALFATLVVTMCVCLPIWGGSSSSS